MMFQCLRYSKDAATKRNVWAALKGGAWPALPSPPWSGSCNTALDINGCSTTAPLLGPSPGPSRCMSTEVSPTQVSSLSPSLSLSLSYVFLPLSYVFQSQLSTIFACRSHDS